MEFFSAVKYKNKKLNIFLVLVFQPLLLYKDTITYI